LALNRPRGGEAGRTRSMPVGMHIPPTSAARPSPTCHPSPTSTGARARQLDRGRAGRADAGMQTCAYAVHGSELLSTRWYMALVVSPPLPLSPPSQKRFMTLRHTTCFQLPPSSSSCSSSCSKTCPRLSTRGSWVKNSTSSFRCTSYLFFYFSIFLSNLAGCAPMLSLIT